ncbi:cytochrome o ubiquinol oxidase subunit IV [soil metagenome]
MSARDDDFDEVPGDAAPGDGAGAGFARGLIGYGVGFCLAAGLTVAAFIAPSTGLIWPPAVPVALVVFAIAQMGVHLVFFLHITTGPDNTNNALALAFGVLIVFLVLAGSLWIMANLNEQMMPMNKVMEMQR